MKKSEGKPRRLSVKKQAVKTGGGGGKHRRTGPVESDVVRIRQRKRPVESDVARIRQRERPIEKERPPKPD